MNGLIILDSRGSGSQTISIGDAYDVCLRLEVLEMAKEPKQLLDRQKCVDSLAALRHAKWFQVWTSFYTFQPLKHRFSSRSNVVTVVSNDHN